MARTPKTPKYDEFADFSNTYVFEEGTERKEYFGDKKPLVLELGCGKAEPTLFFAKKYPQKNFIGI
ncbi:tRNA (guanosine(46)-N7)-methyltransferase TrmB, partial [Candidatus Woesearchaeota archaeon]|nr:tRNA (guanosine(46)-N7)-methyltransferase TrmB [Candidatus Woesearchaeota archaeon]